MFQNVLIIGASRGIGLEWANQFSSRSDINLYLTCRTINSNLQAFQTKYPTVKIIENIDVSDDQVVENLKNCQLLPKTLDLVIFNSGVLKREPKFSDWTTESLIYQFNINSIGPLRAMRGLENKLNEANSLSKFFIVSSRMGSISDASGGLYGYRMSKTAVNMAGKALANDFKDKNIAVGILHPGYVNTEMTDHNGSISPKESVDGMIKIVDQFDLEKTGRFFHMSGEELPW